MWHDVVLNGFSNEWASANKKAKSLKLITNFSTNAILES